MDVRELVAVVRRRWVVLLLLLAVTLAVTRNVAEGVPVRYSAEARVLFEPPVSTGADDEAGNPLTGLTSSLAVVADLVAQVVNDSTTRDRLEDQGAGGYSVRVAQVETVSDNWVAVAGGASVPLLIVQGLGPDPEQALRTVQLVTEQVHGELINQQHLSGADEAAFVTSRILIGAAGATRQSDERTRMVFALLGAGALLSLLLVVLVDGLLLHRRRTRSQLAEAIYVPAPRQLVRPAATGRDRELVAPPAVDTAEVEVAEPVEAASDAPVAGGRRDRHPRPKRDDRKRSVPSDVLLPPMGGRAAIRYLVPEPEDQAGGA